MAVDLGFFLHNILFKNINTEIGILHKIGNVYK